MTKSYAKTLFGSVKVLAEKVGYSASYFYQLPDPLPQRESDRLLGCALRNGLLSIDRNQNAA